MLRCNNNSRQATPRQTAPFKGSSRRRALAWPHPNEARKVATMAVYEIAPNRAGAPLARPVELICFALIVAQAVYLAASWWTGTWLVAADGTGVASDFVNVWAAGKLVWQGTPAAAYDWPVHKAMEVVAVGHPFDGYFGWHYPPTFLFVAAAAGAAALCRRLRRCGCSPPSRSISRAIRGIVGDRGGYLLAAAFPAVLSNFIVGQNGFLTAALIGGALLSCSRTADPRRRTARTADLQAAPRAAVSDRARCRRTLARVHRGQRHRGADGARLVRWPSAPTPGSPSSPISATPRRPSSPTAGPISANCRPCSG